MRKISGTLTAPHGGSPYPRMWRDGRPTLPTTNDCRHGGKGDGTGARPGWRQGHGGMQLPPSLNPQEGGDEEENEDREEGVVTPPPILYHLK
jgi:hypothetical protein